MYFKSYFFLSASIFLIHGPIYAKHADLEQATLMANLIQYQEKNSDAIWPGFHLNKYPIIMEFIDLYQGPVYAFQFKPKNLEWSSMQIQNMEVHYRTGIYYDIGPYITDFLTVENQRSLIFRDFSDNPNSDIDSVIYELFEDYMKNGSHFPGPSFDHAAYTYTGFNNMENVALSKLEYEAIHAYLTKNDIESLKNYIAVHQTRMKLLNAEDVQFEQALELENGTKSYVYKKTSTRSDQDYLKEALWYYPKDSDFCASLTNLYSIRQCLTGNHYTFIDLAAGYALDKMANPDWKTETETQGKSFTTMLAQHFPMNQNEIEQRTQNAKSLYGYESKWTEIHATMKNYLENMQIQLSTYQQLPGSEVSVETTGCSVMDGASYDKTFIINSKFELHTNYKAFNLCDGKKYRMSLNYDNIPYQLKKEEHNSDHSITEFNTVKLPNHTLLIVNDRQETIGSFIQAGKKEKFNRLLIENNQFMVRIIGLEGVLDGTNNALRLTLKKTDSKKKNHVYHRVLRAAIKNDKL